jgi:hypothetical protein
VVEVAQKGCAFEQQSKKEETETWRHIEAALKQMRPASTRPASKLMVQSDGLRSQATEEVDLNEQC